MRNPYTPHTKGFRPVLQSDKDSARRGLEMDTMTDDELLDLRASHNEVDVFASGVIAETAEEVLIERGVL